MRHISLVLQNGNRNKSNKTKAVCPRVKAGRDLSNDGIDAVDDPGLYSFDKGGLASQIQ
jgi:hypothetical protein